MAVKYALLVLVAMAVFTWLNEHISVKRVRKRLGEIHASHDIMLLRLANGVAVLVGLMAILLVLLFPDWIFANSLEGLLVPLPVWVNVIGWCTILIYKLVRYRAASKRLEPPTVEFATGFFVKAGNAYSNPPRELYWIYALIVGLLAVSVLISIVQADGRALLSMVENPVFFFIALPIISYLDRQIISVASAEKMLVSATIEIPKSSINNVSLAEPFNRGEKGLAFREACLVVETDCDGVFRLPCLENRRAEIEAGLKSLGYPIDSADTTDA